MPLTVELFINDCQINISTSALTVGPKRIKAILREETRLRGRVNMGHLRNFIGELGHMSRHLELGDLIKVCKGGRVT